MTQLKSEKYYRQECHSEDNVKMIKTFESSISQNCRTPRLTPAPLCVYYKSIDNKSMKFRIKALKNNLKIFKFEIQRGGKCHKTQL